jgi:GH25 family lysozyme M1 (1,4-beta-N-acetylmuramidase)
MKLPKRVQLRKVKPTSGKMTAGIDVAKYQRTIDWETVENATRHYSDEAPFETFGFAVARVSDGNLLDKYFARNWNQMHAVGLRRGVYQYFRAGRGRAVLQANILLDKVDEAGGITDQDLPPVMDIENLNKTEPGEVIDDVLAWAEHIEKQLGVVPILYTYPAFWCANLLCCCSHMPLWIAHYRGDNLPGAERAMERPPLVPVEQWDRWLIWQHSSTGRVAGVTPGQNVDLNVFNGDEQDLARFIDLAWQKKPWEDYFEPPSDEKPTPEVPKAPDVIVPEPPDVIVPPVVIPPVDIVVDNPDDVPTWSGDEAPTLPSRRPDELAKRPGCMGWFAKLLGGPKR